MRPLSSRCGGTVRSRLVRARSALQQILEGDPRIAVPPGTGPDSRGTFGPSYVRPSRLEAKGRPFEIRGKLGIVVLSGKFPLDSAACESAPDPPESQPHVFLTMPLICFSPPRGFRALSREISPGTLRNWRAMKIGPSFLKVAELSSYPLAELEAWDRKKSCDLPCYKKCQPGRELEATDDHEQALLPTQTPAQAQLQSLINSIKQFFSCFSRLVHKGPLGPHGHSER